jgi:hypothetical protein
VIDERDGEQAQDDAYSPGFRARVETPKGYNEAVSIAEDIPPPDVPRASRTVASGG